MNKNGFIASSYQEAIFAFIRDSSKKHGSVNAVAGSGKSTTCIQASELISRPGIMCAFNKHIVESLRVKLAGTQMNAMTIHGIGMRTLIKGLIRKPRLVENKYAQIIRGYMREFRGEFTDSPEAAKHLSDLSRFIRLTLTDYNNFGAVAEMADRYNLDFEFRYAPMIRSILDHGQRLAETNGDVDYTDMIYLPNRLDLKPDRYDWIFVDEAQDLSTAQREIVTRCLNPGTGRALFVGDPYQAIMFFAGADSRSFQAIQSALDTQEFPLSICYRCPKSIVSLAKEIVPQIEARRDAPPGVIEERTEQDLQKDAQPGDLIMCRKNAPLLKHCLRLIRNGIHARVRGRDVGKELANLALTIGKRAVRYESFLSETESYRQEQKAILIARDASDTQLEMLDDKCSAVAECYEGFSGSDSAEGLALEIESIFSDYGSAVWFSSIHRAKGLEAQRCWILQFDKLGQPWGRDASPDQIQQEINLRYVAITRSLDTLYLVNTEQ